MSVLDEVAIFLQTAGVGTIGTDLFKGSRPDEPDDCVTIYEYPGNASEYVQNKPTPNQESVQLQIVGRGKQYEVVRAKVKIAWDAMQLVQATLSGVKYRRLHPNASLGLIGRDNNDRVLIGFNATAEKEPS